MTYENFTTKAQEAIIQAQKIAKEMDQQQVDTPHLFAGIMTVDESVADFIFKKVGLNAEAVRREVKEALIEYPKVKGATKQYLTNDANRALSRAKKMLVDFGDQYISIELMLLGIIQGASDKGARFDNASAHVSAATMSSSAGTALFARPSSTHRSAGIRSDSTLS